MTYSWSSRASTAALSPPAPIPPAGAGERCTPNQGRRLAGALIVFRPIFAQPHLTFLLSPHLYPGLPKHHQRRTAAGTKGFRGSADKVHLLIAHLPQFLGEILHIPIHPGLHVVVEGRHAALFQHAQSQQCPLVCPGDVVVDIIADYSVKISSGKSSFTASLRGNRHQAAPSGLPGVNETLLLLFRLLLISSRSSSWIWTANSIVISVAGIFAAACASITPFPPTSGRIKMTGIIK